MKPRLRRLIAKAAATKCLERGLLVLGCGSYGNVIRVLSPLTIEKAMLTRGLDILEQSILEAASEHQA